MPNVYEVEWERVISMVGTVEADCEEDALEKAYRDECTSVYEIDADDRNYEVTLKDGEEPEDE